MAKNILDEAREAFANARTISDLDNASAIFFGSATEDERVELGILYHARQFEIEAERNEKKNAAADAVKKANPTYKPAIEEDGEKLQKWAEATSEIQSAVDKIGDEIEELTAKIKGMKKERETLLYRLSTLIRRGFDAYQEDEPLFAEIQEDDGSGDS